ncbi:hypothetical protein O0L34_g8964 [Tuta absoluta]|nr:hypothetical protein O0L34_g8964 [Tuta absoluta]
MKLRELFIVAALIAGGGAVYNRERDRQRTDQRVLERACELSSCYPATGNLLIGRESRLFATSTCGLHGRERFCIVSHLEERKKCFWCDTSNSTANQPLYNHRIQNIIYKYHPGTKTKSWWQAENGKENVTIQLDMEAEFHFTHLIIQFKTFRPKAMLVERSFDFGKTWRVYRYFAHNCNEAFPGVPVHSPRNLTEVVCESRYSGVAPSSEGEVIFRVLPPNINVVNPYSEEVQNLLRMTNLRINFTQLHTLGDDYLDNRGEIQEKYYYAIYEMTVRGSCSCYGHASRCLPMPGVQSQINMVHGRCECTHNTRGLNCEYCEDFFNDLPWQPAVSKNSNTCKRCTCNNHATTCHFDPAVYNKTGKISGGVCDNCQHNTMGVNCERCQPKFYRDPNLDIQSPEICKPCDCDPQGTTEQDFLCDDETDEANNKTAGRCHCKTNMDGLRCDRCKDGYWNFNLENPDGCEACTCNPLGTINERGCDQFSGNCFCKRHVTGRNCDQCLSEFYGLSDSEDGCLACDCDPGGSLGRDCDVITGQCRCRPNVSGRRCDQPIQNFFVGALDNMVIEAESSLCDSQLDDNAIQSHLCHIVIREPFPDGRKETWTGPGFMKLPEGSTLVFIINNLKKSMNYNILIRYEPQSAINWEEATILVKRPFGVDSNSPCANVRPEDDTISTKLPSDRRSVLVVPSICLEADKETEIRFILGRQDGQNYNPRATVLIDSIVLIPSFDDIPFLEPNSPGWVEFNRYGCGDPYYFDLGRDNVPEVCKKYHASIGFIVRNGSESCDCDPTGSESFRCDSYTGQCTCRRNIVGARCDRCPPGTYGFGQFGCDACDCNSIGSLDNFCDPTSGQCKCRANTYGRACNLCQPGYFNFPNCQQCDCNGHAVECDDKTGACKNCGEYTEGHRCERCIEGYYGDPRLGIDIPCRSCPCPGVQGDPNKNNHADRCELDSETQDVVCDCKEGYAGLLCDVCADNYYGDPLKGTCEKCDCSENTDVTKPGNCDPYTGDCLKCLHNTAGPHCEICEEGYFGDALEKSCFKCNCSVLGTNFTQGHCDGITGQCFCFPNVIGVNCDQCAENHWRIARGTGCDPCGCDPIGSVSPQCNPYVGNCECKPGHGGRQCDQCQENHWGNPNIECYECDCDPYGSALTQCNRETGACVCKPGMGGYRCDQCARGYSGNAPVCEACGECFDSWDKIIDDLRSQTEYAIGNASKIKLVGATGAYTRDFEEMTKKLAEIENLLESTENGQTTIQELLGNVTNLQEDLNAAEQKVKESNNNLNAITSKINLGNSSLDGLRTSIENLKLKTLDLSNNATKLQEANLEGALNLTREAKERSMKASDDAESVQQLIANTDRQIKNTDHLIGLQYASFNSSQNDNDKKLADIQQQLNELESQMPKLNDKMCGLESDSCDICGGAGCGKCGGISCDQGAVTKAEQALDFANKTENRIKEHELSAEDLFRSVSQVKQDTVAVKARAKDLHNRAAEFKNNAERVTNESHELITELRGFLSNTSNTPTDVRTLANDILNMSISIEPKEITELSQQISSTVSQLTNIENIITETKPNLERAKELKINATGINKAANLTLQMANKVLEALDEAQAAQDAAENAISKANSDIEAAKNDLTPIAMETEKAQKKANETKKNVEDLRSQLSSLQRDILKIESDAEQVKLEASDVVNRAESAETKANQLRQEFKQTNMSLSERASQTSNSRARAQLLLNRATKLASDTQQQLKQLQNLEDLYNTHNDKLKTLEKEVGDLNSQMNFYVEKITMRSNEYRSCRTWLYLEPILSNDDGELGTKFRKVDQGFRQVTRILESDPRLSALLQSSRLQPMLDSISEQLLACQSALNKYIDEKRSIFPRLYFLSDDDLLELLGQARAGADGREAVMQTHLKKLFPGTTGVRLGPGGLSITALCSHYGETFQLDHPVDIDCAVEMWLKNLETEMRSSLKNMTQKCVITNSLQEQDPFSLPTQILCLAQNIRFTEQAEKAINSKDLHKLKANVEKENLYYASAEVEDESEKQKRQALILQCAYYLSVIKTLIENNVASTNDWLWQKQLRFYLTSTKEVVAKMGLAQISYSYEYLGVNTGQFVRTELADECFLVLTQALHLGLVGNPFGPAGTGKTESVKALGGLVGRLVLIFNCDEAMDAECMGRLLTGLSLSGAWGCFDEFNRLTADTLAAVSHQLASLLTAMQQRRPEATATLNGKQVTVSEWCGVAATMNPVGRGYGGRRALPAALERVLRPIAMTQPAGQQLATHLLAARCIADAEQLAEQLHTVFIMASTLLSAQRHYDWGLRALKATIGSCGASLGARGASDANNALRRALRLNSISKLTQQDAERFENILSTVFANLPEEDSSTDTLSPSLEASLATLGIVHNKLQIQKCKELYEQMQQRMGVVIVGPPGSGKTTIRQLLKTALTQQGKNIVEYIICPKAMSRNCLLGHIDHDTRQWTDGVISSTALEISNQPPDVWSWVVCDGDIDPEWIEALNSVLDDNRLLTLPSGWRIQFGPNVNFIFETHSLEHASPATVSRMGIILLSEDSSCAPEVLENWALNAEYENETAKMALPLLQQVIKKTLAWLAGHRTDSLFKLYDVSVVKQILTQFEYAVHNIGVSVVHVTPEDLVYLALQRSVIGLLKENAVDSFQQEMSDILGPPLTPPLPASEWVSDSLLLCARLAACEAGVRACVHSHHAHLLIVGPDACAKKLYIEMKMFFTDNIHVGYFFFSLLAEYVIKESNSTVITIDCTPILEPADIIAELKRNNVVRSGGKGGRAKNGRVTLLVRALHRAQADSWGSRPVQSFLLQLIQQSGFWVRGGEEEGGMQWCGVCGIRVIATAASVSALCVRTVAAVGIVCAQEPEEDELLELARHYLRQSVDKNIPEKDVSDLASAVLSMYKEVTETFESRAHYKWNASHLQKWCENVKWYSPTNTAEVKMAIASEANMIFKDRLIDEEEKATFYSISKSHLKGKSNEGTYFLPKVRGDGVYLEAVDHRDWYQTTQKLINQCLTEHEYNVFGETGAEVCSEIAVLCPAMARATNGGIAVCVGSAGSGRRAAAHVVTAALSASLYFVNHPKQFNNNFKNALSTSAEGTRTLLVITESAANNCVLAAIESHTRAAPSDQITMQISENTKQNLGIVICLDKDQDNLPELIEKFPLLYNESHMVWLERWSGETLRQLPQLIIQRLIKENVTESTKDQHEAIPVEGFVSIYSSLDGSRLLAPCRYVSFVKSYYHIVSRKKTALVQRQNMLTSGVEALRRARSEVASLQKEAAEQEIALSDKQAKANQALDQIGATVRATTDKKEEMHALKKNIEVENKKLQVRKKEIEEELASVEPIIAAARAAVGDIKSESLSEVRSLRAPPDVVRDVLEGVLRLMGIADTSWHSMKNFLSKRGVKEDIRCLDASQISPEAVQSVQKLLERRGGSFEQATAKRASAACAPLAAWVKANLAYADALARVQPLQQQQRQLHKNLKDAEAQLEALSSGLATVDERVAALKDQLGQHTRDAAAIELKLSNAKKTIEAARSLLDQLAHEYSAWEIDLENISKEISELTLRSLLAAAYIVYLPDVTEPQAKEYINKWSSLIGFEDSTFTVINFLSTTEKQLKWDADGLPLDKTAIKNAILIDQILEAQKCGFTPLIIDPDGDAIGWLKNSLADVQSDFVSQHSDKLHTAVQYAVRLGRVLVVTEVDAIHDCWSALLSGLPVTTTGAASPVASRLLLYSRDTTLHTRLPPNYAARLSILHFTARLDGLTDQLVHYALQQQNPEVNEKAKEIKLKKATLQKQQHELQENLLKDLSTNGDILHDANLLASLNKTRATSTVISEALEAAKAIERETTSACEAYEPSAYRAAILALAVKSLAAQRPLVALPVDTILDVFVDAIRRETDQKKINNEAVVKYITRRIIERVLLGLHKKDKYIIVLHLLKQVYEDLMPEKLWQIFVGNFDISEDQGIINEIKNKYSWIPENCLKKMAQLRAASEDLFEKLSLNNDVLWTEFLNSGELSTLSRLKLSGFETVAAVAVLRPDTLYRAIVVFVDQILGTGVVSAGDGIQRAGVWGAGRRGGGARGVRPVLLLGAHATDVLAAHKHTLTQVGIEEGIAAWEAAVEASRGGGWLALVVGASPFTQDLHTFLVNFGQRSSQDFNDEFRLWIVSEDREIPPLISNACVNVILEAPEGVKQNLIGTLSAWGQYEAEPKQVRLHACLALFHALVQERRAYIPQGWTRWYSWEWGEISACTSVIRSNSSNIQTARALSLVLYNARVGTERDRKLLAALMMDCLGDQALGHSWKPRGLDIQLPFAKQLQVRNLSIVVWSCVTLKYAQSLIGSY